MKKQIFTLIAFAFLALSTSAQNAKLAVVSFDVRVQEFSGNNLTELLRIEFAKHAKYEVLDRYEVNEILEAQKVSANSCFSKSCLVNAGKLLSADKVATGSIDKIGESLFLRIRLIDVAKGVLEKEVVKEYLFLPEKINTMLTIGINEIMGVVNDELLETSLTSKESYESAVNNPDYNSLSLAGPRMGYTFLTGDAATIFKQPKSEGGYNGFPALFQFGYQFEKQYLNEGKIQALFEFIPMVSGLDQGLFIPSITFLNGLRNNVNGVEVAIGPSINLVKESMQFQDSVGVWHRTTEMENIAEYDEVSRMDSKGNVKLKTYVVIAAGFTIRSGKMNIPINAFVIPSRNNMRFGFSFGFNARG